MITVGIIELHEQDILEDLGKILNPTIVTVGQKSI